MIVILRSSQCLLYGFYKVIKMLSLSNKILNSIYNITLLIIVSFALFVAVQPAFSKENSVQNATKTATLEKPLLVIRYNQNNVYFKPAVKKIVDVVEVEKSGAMYHIESLIPTEKASENGIRLDPKDDKNLLFIVAYMNELAVSMDRIVVNSMYSANVKNQEIKFFIK